MSPCHFLAVLQKPAKICSQDGRWSNKGFPEQDGKLSLYIQESVPFKIQKPIRFRIQNLFGSEFKSLFGSGFQSLFGSGFQSLFGSGFQSLFGSEFKSLFGSEFKSLFGSEFKSQHCDTCSPCSICDKPVEVKYTKPGDWIWSRKQNLTECCVNY
jgi:hypothetical protein